MLTIPHLIKILGPLSEETRYNLVKLLLNHDYCVSALAKKLNLSKSAVSQHLKVLRNAGIVKGNKRGYFMHYHVDRDVLKYVAQEIIKLSEKNQNNLKCSKTIINTSYKRKGGNNIMNRPPCKHPELRPKEGNCSKEQIEICHGNEKVHPCNEKK